MLDSRDSHYYCIIYAEVNKTEMVCFCPLAIDELPLVRSLDAPPHDDNVEFSLRNRWDVRSFWGDSELLLTNDAGLPSSIFLRREDLEDAQGLIESDVRTRDYRLIMQARRLAVFNPLFSGVLAKGVDSEIACAVFHRVPVHIYEDPSHDPNGRAQELFRREPGSLGTRPGEEYITFHRSVEEVLEELAR